MKMVAGMAQLVGWLWIAITVLVLAVLVLDPETVMRVSAEHGGWSRMVWSLGEHCFYGVLLVLLGERVAKQ